MLKRHAPNMKHSLRVLAHLLRYPDAQMRAHASEMAQALADEAALPSARIDELQRLLRQLASDDAMRVESTYVDVFDRGRSTALHLFEHVHGDSRDRGPAMIDLIQTYEQAGLYLAPDELPDHLPVLLEFASTQPAAHAREFLGEFAHILQVIFSALQKRESAYASVLAAVLELAGEHAAAVAVAADEPLDESWAEPEAFGDCPSAATAMAGGAQPLRFVKSAANLGAQP